MLTDHSDCLFKVAVDLDRAMFKGAINPSGLRHTDHGASVPLPSNYWGDDDNKVVQTEMQHARFGQRQCCLRHVSSTSVQFVRSIWAVQQLLDLID